ncbi:response regulator transcription factor [Chloroflexota bacterium]
MKVLMIEDSPKVRNSVQLCLKVGMSEAEFVSVGEGRKGIELVQNELPDIIILDLGLPDIDGIQVIESIRRFSSVPIIILTVRNSDWELAQALETGANDYITKPFRPLELLSRIRAGLRSHESLSRNENPSLALGRITINSGTREVLYNDKPLHLTPTQYELLYFLVQNSPQAVPYITLEDRLWGDDVLRRPGLKNAVWELRKKLGDASGTIIQTVRGYGYKYNP